jgi:hypothetical protein
VPEQQDRETLPGEQTAPFPPPTLDTGGFGAASDPPIRPTPEPQVPPWQPPSGTDEAPASEPVGIPAHPVVVPGSYQYLKRWTFVLVVLGVWIAAAAVGLGLYYWWYNSIDKTAAVFVVMVYIVVCTVGSLLIAMVQNKPMMAALAIALMSAPLASTGAAAALYGGYAFGWIAR